MQRLPADTNGAGDKPVNDLQEMMVMNGMELSKAYFVKYQNKLLERGFEAYRGHMAFGLVGEGSECFGFDDRYSRDHDFSAEFCVWLPGKLYEEIGESLQAAYNSLPDVFGGADRNNQSPEAAGRRGVMAIEDFYRKFTNLEEGPKNVMDWLMIPEGYLFMATNGEVFCDYFGRFTEIRERLKAFYPEDVLRKKLAARIAVMAQAGQYNYGRSLKRGDYPGAYLAGGEFVKASLSAIHLINRAYLPFYKWAFHSAGKLALLQKAIHDLAEFVQMPDHWENQTRKQWLIEAVCLEVRDVLRAMGFSDRSEDFLYTHSASIMEGIKDRRIRSLPVTADFSQ